MRRPKPLEDENARLQKRLAAFGLDEEMASGRSPPVRRSRRTDVERRELRSRLG